jgi:hypothetical protein
MESAVVSHEGLAAAAAADKAVYTWDVLEDREVKE